MPVIQHLSMLPTREASQWALNSINEVEVGVALGDAAADELAG